MRSSIFAAAAVLSTTALAQTQGLPSCAQSCFGNNFGSCGMADVKCICSNTSVLDGVSCCVFSTCSQADIKSTIEFSVNLCKGAGVQVNTQPVCPPGGSASASKGGPAATPAPGGVPGPVPPQGGGSPPNATASTHGSGAPGATGAAGAAGASPPGPSVSAPPSGATPPSGNSSVSMSHMSGMSHATAATGSLRPSGSGNATGTAAASAAGAPQQTAAVGLGMALAGMLALL